MVVGIVVDGHARAVHGEDVIANPGKILLNRHVVGGNREDRGVELGAVGLGDELVDLAQLVGAGDDGVIMMVVVAGDHVLDLIGLQAIRGRCSRRPALPPTVSPGRWWEIDVLGSTP